MQADARGSPPAGRGVTALAAGPAARCASPEAPGEPAAAAESAPEAPEALEAPEAPEPGRAVPPGLGSAAQAPSTPAVQEASASSLSPSASSQEDLRWTESTN